MAERAAVDTETVPIWRLFMMLSIQKLYTFKYYQGGEVLILAIAVFEIIARSLIA